MKFGTPEIVTGLRDLLGARLVAYLGRVSNTRSVREWAGGERTPGGDVVQRLRTAYYIAGLLHERESAATIQSWFQGMNPELDDAASATLLRTEPLGEIGSWVIAAARSFASVGC